MSGKKFDQIADALAAGDAVAATLQHALLRGNSDVVATEADWSLGGVGGCRGVDPKYPGQKCGIPMKHTGTPHRFCRRQPHDGYCVGDCFWDAR